MTCVFLIDLRGPIKIAIMFFPARKSGRSNYPARRAARKGPGVKVMPRQVTVPSALRVQGNGKGKRKIWLVVPVPVPPPPAKIKQL